MPIGRAAYVEIIRRGELPGVAVGGADADGDLSSRRQINTAEQHGLSRNAIAELVGTFVAQELLDGAFDQVCIGDQSISLIGVLGRSSGVAGREIAQEARYAAARAPRAVYPENCR